jgi:hypothetical protein
MKNLSRIAGCVLVASVMASAGGSMAATNSAAAPVVRAAAVQTAGAVLRDPAAVKKQFDSVASHLDQGGDLLVIANVDGIVEKAAEWIRTIVTATSAGDPNADAVRAAASKLPGFLRRNGFYSIQGFGISAVPRADGLTEMKSYVSRDPAAAHLPLWRALVGNKPRRVACLDMIPADASMFQVMVGEPAALWTMVKQGVSEVGGPDAAKSFDKAMASFAKAAGVPMDAIVKSLGDECFWTVVMPPEAAAPDAQGGAPAMPWGNASVLAGVAVRDDTLFNLISNKLTQAGQPVALTNIGAAVVLKVGAEGGPLPIMPCVAKFNGYLVLSLDEKALSSAVNAFGRKNGLAATPEFKKMFANRPLVNNGMSYTTPRFVQKIMELQGMAMAMTGGGPQASELAALQKMMMGDTNQTSASVTIVTPEGVLLSGLSSMNGRDMVTAMAAAPVGMMAAIAIPSFVKARSTSSSMSCVNNLRMMDAGKEQWAMEANKETGAEPDLQGVCAYIKGARLPVCPQGGEYSLNAIGQNPTCTIPGHELPR